MKISYYDLLGLVQKGKEPKEIELKITKNNLVEYIAEYDDIDSSFSHYYIKNVDNHNETYQLYLSDCFFESSMFDKCITITKEK